MNSAEKLRLLRQRMQEQGMDAYVVVTDDFHGSEYVGDYFKAREYLSGLYRAPPVRWWCCRTAPPCGRTGGTFCRRRISWPGAPST